MQQPPLLMYKRRLFCLTSGKPLNSTALATVKTVAFTPMPSASMVTATAVNPGFFARVRRPKRISPSTTLLTQDMATRRSQVFEGNAAAVLRLGHYAGWLLSGRRGAG